MRALGGSRTAPTGVFPATRAFLAAAGPEWLPVVYGAADVIGHEAFGVGSAAFSYGGEDLAVFRHVIVQPVGVCGPPGQEPPPYLDQPERAEHPRQLVVARGTGERHVEVAAGVVSGDPVTRTFLARDDLFEMLEVFLRSSLGCEACDGRLHDGTHLHASQHGVQSQIRHPETPVGVKIYQALAGEAPQGLAHGGA